ncbi:type I-E CRISPR-associated protein Cse2/CasB [Lysinibacter sp. HNR]|uniref:type I-E CRISPR-associated protein Cse2/CasB n=1 Tax=Lysinibacter sp. HNR TaxID=3031408 RepID=UPI002435B96A|nr:type I-E CRISPR-associated protein Cse2/CasB [Lysinibacter sp. HNR]WGD37189.1 type I-E CRISPR-associated protein Cse2/CasB [Lysinibacter sp. HNR]
MSEQTDSSVHDGDQPQKMWNRYWKQHAHLKEGMGLVPPGEHLAALRKGAYREPWTVPDMWPFLTEVSYSSNGLVPERIKRQEWAEHTALVLYGFHQQSQSESMHTNQYGHSLGRAMRQLFDVDNDPDNIMDSAMGRRVRELFFATSMPQLFRQILTFTQLFTASGQNLKLNYNVLFDDLVQWQQPNKRDSVRSRWGRDFYATPAKSK